MKADAKTKALTGSPFVCRVLYAPFPTKLRGLYFTTLARCVGSSLLGAQSHKPSRVSSFHEIRE